MADITISRSQSSREVIFIFNEVERDHYQDATIKEVGRFKKQVLVKKNTDMNFVQFFDVPEFLEDSDKIPWVVNFTETDLPRAPRADDQILLEGVKYTISMVSPVNREIPSILSALVYPERSEFNDRLYLYKVNVLYNYKPIDSFNNELFNKPILLDIYYGGCPLELSFDGNTFYPFKSKILISVDEEFNISVISTLDGSNLPEILPEPEVFNEVNVNDSLGIFTDKVHLYIKDNGNNIASINV